MAAYGLKTHFAHHSARGSILWPIWIAVFLGFAGFFLTISPICWFTYAACSFWRKLAGHGADDTTERHTSNYVEEKRKILYRRNSEKKLKNLSDTMLEAMPHKHHHHHHHHHHHKRRATLASVFGKDAERKHRSNRKNSGANARGNHVNEPRRRSGNEMRRATLAHIFGKDVQENNQLEVPSDIQTDQKGIFADVVRTVMFRQYVEDNGPTYHITHTPEMIPADGARRDSI